MDLYLQNVEPPTCCSETSFDKLIWDIWSELCERPDDDAEANEILVIIAILIFPGLFGPIFFYFALGYTTWPA